MLRNVIVDYLSKINERDLDLPFLALLLKDGYFDVHLTHGSAEFGKDFIAKRANGSGTIEQWCFQSKAGDMGQSDWREVLPQLLEAATVAVGHPAFDERLPRRVALVTTGRLKGNAPISAQSFSRETLEGTLNLAPLAVWDADYLAEHFARSASNAFAPNASDLIRFGSFLKLYGEALRGEPSVEAVEVHSRQWISTSTSNEFEVVFEAALLASAFRESKLVYHEFHCYLVLMRGLLALGFDGQRQNVDPLLQTAQSAAESVAWRLVSEVEVPWRAAGLDLMASAPPLDPVGYLVACSCVAEAASFLALTASETATRLAAIDFVEAWIQHEPGTVHPLSDKYAVATVWTLVALVAHGRQESARDLLRRSTIWVCDRYENGGHLAPVGALARDEVRALLGAAYEFMELPKRRQSFLACALGDLAAFLGDASLYALVVNDLKAMKIAPEYWQSPDTRQQLSITGDELVQFINVRFTDHLSAPHAEHRPTEPRTFGFAERHGVEFAVGLSLLLRDRYFPNLWASVVASVASRTDSTDAVAQSPEGPTNVLVVGRTASQ